jgi:colanic acid/amylovoran biosynthesis protein
MTRPPVRVLILNAVAMNGGDGALLDALVARAREAYGGDARITVADATPSDSAQAFPEFAFVPTVLGDPPGSTAEHRARRSVQVAKALRGLRLVVGALVARALGMPLAARVVSAADREAVLAYAHADVAISSGGTSLVEHYSLLKRWLAFEYAFAAGVPLVLFTQSLGPFTRRSNRVLVRRLMRHARLVLLRDERSRRHLREVGASVARCTVSADAAFGVASVAGVPVVGRPRRVAISVRFWPYAAQVQGRDTTESYRAAIVALAEHIVRGGGEVVFLSTCQGVPTYTDDSVEAALIADRVADDCRQGVSVDRAHRRAEALVDAVAGFDAVVATRMHMSILSMLAGRPVLPIAYEFKTEELFARLGEPALAIPLQDVTPEVLVEAYEAFAARTPALAAALAAGVAEQHAVALSVAESLRRAVPELI